MGDFLMFRRMVTPWVILALFWLGVGASVVVAAVLIIRAAVPGSEGDLMSLAGGVAVLVLGPVATRVFCEVLILLFRMNETLTDIRTSLIGPHE